MTNALLVDVTDLETTFFSDTFASAACIETNGILKNATRDRKIFIN